MALLRIAGLVMALAAGAAGWVLNAAERRVAPPLQSIAVAERPEIDMDARARRALLERAHVRLPPPHAGLQDVATNPRDPDGLLTAPHVECRFVSTVPSGTTPKFDCMLSNGEIVKVKYGRNAELHAEAAATRLLSALGYPADQVFFIPRVRCHGCPRHPFLAMHLLTVTHMNQRFPLHGWSGAYTDFNWAAVERRFGGTAVETATDKGWAWWELDAVDPERGASRADVDALRLMAVFLAHWDNKASNQRLVCLPAAAPGERKDSCRMPLLMMQDLGSTFGPSKVNLARWASAPVWLDRRRCTVSMRSFPWHGGTFADTAISEAGRQRLLQGLESIRPEQVRGLFRGARFAEFYSATDDEQDIREWSSVFAERVRTIAAGGPCPEHTDARSR